MMTKYIYFSSYMSTYIRHIYRLFTYSILHKMVLRMRILNRTESWNPPRIRILVEGGVCAASSEHKYYTLKSETCFNQLTSNVNAESSIKTALSEQRPHARRSVTTSPCNEKTLKIWWNIPDMTISVFYLRREEHNHTLTGSVEELLRHATATVRLMFRGYWREAPCHRRRHSTSHQSSRTAVMV